jgi:hypothetical protein
MTSTVTDLDLARAFARRLLECVGGNPERLATIDAQNTKMPPYACASHDHCDANIAMENALQDFGMSMWSDDEESGPDQKVLDLVNAAWNVTRAKGFYRTLQEYPMKLFVVAGSTHTLVSMLEANADDPDCCDWLNTAQCGDVLHDGEGCVRVA